MTLSQCHQNNISSWSTLMRLHPTKFFPGTLFGGSIPTTFPLRQLCGVVFSKHFIWGKSPELYCHTFIWGNSPKLYSHTFIFRQLCRVVSSHHFLFEAILHNCIFKIFTLKQFYRIVFSKYFLQDNSSESYYTKVSLRQLCEIVFSKYSKYSLQENFPELYPHILF